MRHKIASVLVLLALLTALPFVAFSASGNREIVFDGDTATAYVGKQQHITATVTRLTNDAPSWTGLVWSSSDETIARVDQSGNVTGVSTGSVMITVKAQDDASICASVSVDVRIPVTGMKMSTSSITLLAGADPASAVEQLSCIIEPQNAFHQEVIWTSSNEKVVTVDSTGLVTAVSKGYATITAKSTDPTMPWLSSTCQVNVGQAVTGLTLSADSSNLPAGSGLSLTAKALPADASNTQVTWSTSDASIATVSEWGYVQGITAGTATITATAKDGSGVSASCVVTIVNPVKKITIEQKSISLPRDEHLHIISAIEPEDATVQELEWKSSNEKVATVDEYGIVTGVSNGTTTITVAATDGSRVSTTVQVTVEDFDLIFTSRKTQTVKYYYGSGQFTITGSVKTGNVSIPNMYISMSAMVVGGMASDDVNVTPVKPGADVVTIKVNNKNYTYKVFVSEDAFPELFPAPDKDTEVEK